MAENRPIILPSHGDNTAMTENIIDDFIKIENAAHDGAFGDNPRAIPTDAQAVAGNYKLGRVTAYGLPIAIEQPRNSYRTGIDQKTGKRWTNRLAAHYGYFSGTKGADGDGVDCFIGFYPQSEYVYIINQFVGGRFDEHKVMLCFPDEQTAINAYLNSYDKGWNGLHSIITASITQLKWWLKNGSMKNPIALNHLPYDGLETMNQRIIWDSSAYPNGMTLDKLLYDIKRTDSGENLIFDAVSIQDILEGADSVLAFDALVTPYAKLEQKMKILQRVMDRKGGTIRVASLLISDPFKQSGVAQVAAIFELSDGQTVSIFFHNPDVDPRKIQQDDELISWKWLLNKKDITIAVAPERGKDLDPKAVAERIMRLADKNSPAFVRANSKRAEKMQAIEDIKTEITGLEQELKDAQHELEVAKVEAEDRAANPEAMAEGLNPTSPEGYAKIKGIANMELRHQDALDDFFQDRIIAVRNALMDVGWSGVRQKGNYDLSKNGYLAKFNFKRVGAGANVVGYYVSIMDGNDIQAEIGDRLTDTPADVAASIDAVITNAGRVTQDNYPSIKSDIAPAPEITPDPTGETEAFKQATLKALIDNFGWQNQSTVGSPLFWVTKEIGGGSAGGMVNPEGIRRVSAKIDGDVMKAIHGDNALVSVEFSASATAEQNAKALNDAVNAIDPNYVNDRPEVAPEPEVTPEPETLIQTEEQTNEQENQQAEVAPEAEEGGSEALESEAIEIVNLDGIEYKPMDVDEEEARGNWERAINASDNDEFEAAKQTYKAMQGHYVNTSIGRVFITGIGWREIKQGLNNDSLRSKTVPFIPVILKTGEAGAIESLHKDRKDDITGFYRFTKVIQIEDKQVTAVLKVAQKPKGEMVYHLRPFDNGVLDSVEGAGLLRVLPDSPTPQESAELTLDSSVDQDGGSINIFILKVTDLDGNEIKELEDVGIETEVIATIELKQNNEPETENEPLPVSAGSDEAITPAVEEPNEVDNSTEESIDETQAVEDLDPAVAGNTELDKQKAKLKSLTDLQERMKAANKVVGNKKFNDAQKIEQLVAQGFSDEQASDILKPDYAGRTGFTSYQLTNNNAVIKNTQKRIAQLEAQALAESMATSGDRETSYDFDGGTIDLDYSDDRLRVNFDVKPAPDMISKLKQNGFKWSPTNTAWQRQLTDNAISTANYIFGAKIKTAAQAMTEEVNKPRGEVIVPATTETEAQVNPIENPLKAGFEAELRELNLETDIIRFDSRLDEIAGRIELAGMMDEMDVELNETADVLTMLMAEAEKSTA